MPTSRANFRHGADKVAQRSVDENRVLKGGEQPFADFVRRPGVARPDQPGGHLAQQRRGIFGKRVARPIETGPAGMKINKRHGSPADDLRRLSHPLQFLDHGFDPPRADEEGRVGQPADNVLGQFLAGQQFLGQQRRLRLDQADAAMQFHRKTGPGGGTRSHLAFVLPFIPASGELSSLILEESGMREDVKRLLPPARQRHPAACICSRQFLAVRDR